MPLHEQFSSLFTQKRQCTVNPWFGIGQAVNGPLLLEAPSLRLRLRFPTIWSKPGLVLFWRGRQKACHGKRFKRRFDRPRPLSNGMHLFYQNRNTYASLFAMKFFAGLLRAKKENARTVHRPSAFCGDVFAAVNLSPLRYGCRVGERRLHPPQTPPSRRLGSAPVPACLPRLVWRCAKMAARHKGNARKELVQCDTPPLFPSKGNDRECRARQGHFSTEQTGKQERCYLC